MAFYIATGATAPGLTVGGTDLSDHVKSIEVPYTYEPVDVTAMGATSKSSSPGLRDDKIVVTFFQDFASAKVDATLNAMVGSSSGTTVIAFSSGVAASSTAPKYTLVAWLAEYSPINVGAPGEASTTEVTFLPIAGQAIQRGTS